MHVDVYSSFGGATLGTIQAAHDAGAVVVGVVAVDAGPMRLGALRVLVGVLAESHGWSPVKVAVISRPLGPGPIDGDDDDDTPRAGMVMAEARCRNAFIKLLLYHTPFLP